MLNTHMCLNAYTCPNVTCGPPCLMFRWSYAILLWEITSYGDTPFREYDFSELPIRLENGARPRREAACNDEL